METLFLFPLAFTGLCLILIALRVVFWYGRPVLWYWQDSLDAFSERLREHSDRAACELQRRIRKREFLRRLAAKIGAGEASGSPDSEMVEAQRQTPVLRRLVEVEIPEMTLRCAKIHRLAALAAGAVLMEEVANEPECLALRQGVVDLEEVAVDMIGGYTRLLDSEPLLQNLIVLRKRILPTCKNCPYLQYTVAEAPPLCPSAEIARIRCENREAHDGRKQKNR